MLALRKQKRYVDTGPYTTCNLIYLSAFMCKYLLIERNACVSQVANLTVEQVLLSPTGYLLAAVPKGYIFVRLIADVIQFCS